MGEASEQGGDSAGNEHRPGQHHDHHVLHVPVVVALVAIVVFFATVARVEFSTNLKTPKFYGLSTNSKRQYDQAE